MNRSTMRRGVARRREFLRGLVLGGAGLASLGLLAACGGAAALPSSSPTVASSAATSAAASSSATASVAASTPALAGKNLVIAQDASPSGMDPHNLGGTPDMLAAFNIFDTLLTRKTDLKLVPSLATEWKTLNDTTWEFKLRKDVKFHNGDALTAKDVKFSAERTMDPNSKAYSRVLATVDHVETPDDYTVRYVTKKPDPLLPDRLAFLRAQIIPMDWFTKNGIEALTQQPVGSGPLKFVEWKKDQHLLLARNDDYWGGPIAFETVTLRGIPEMSTRISALKKGEIHIASRVSPDHWDTLNQGPGFHGEAVRFAGLYVLVINVKNPPLGNRFVRLALNAAIDRATLLKEIYRGQGAIPNSMVPLGSFAHDDRLPPYAYDPNKAREFLKQANYNNEPIIIESANYLAGDKQMSEAIAGMWKDVGINGKVEMIEYAVRAQKKRDKSFKGLFWGDPNDTVYDPDGLMYYYIGPGGVYDYTWRDPEFDAAGEDARTTLDKERRLKDYQLMTRIFNENMPLLPIFQPNELYGVANTIDFKPYGDQTIELRNFNLKRKG